MHPDLTGKQLYLPEFGLTLEKTAWVSINDPVFLRAIDEGRFEKLILELDATPKTKRQAKKKQNATPPVDTAEEEMTPDGNV